jgi:hypothetical protein
MLRDFWDGLRHNANDVFVYRIAAYDLSLVVAYWRGWHWIEDLNDGPRSQAHWLGRRINRWWRFVAFHLAMKLDPRGPLAAVHTREGTERERKLWRMWCFLLTPALMTAMVQRADEDRLRQEAIDKQVKK